MAGALPASFLPMSIQEYIDLPVLEEREQKFVDWMASGLSPAACAKKAGYSNGSYGSELARKPHIRAHIDYHMAQHAKEMGMTRERIQEGLIEAIEMAKEVQDPGSMIRGWEAIARVTGLGAPEKKEIDLKFDPKAANAQAQLEKLPTTELLELAGSDLDAIDGEFEEIFDSDVR